MTKKKVWKKEVKKFTKEDGYVSILKGNAVYNIKILIIKGKQIPKTAIVVTTAATASRRVVQILDRRFKSFVTDECRAYNANKDTQFYEKMSSALQHSRHYIPASGTMLDKHLHLFTTLNTVDPRRTPDFMRFTSLFCDRFLFWDCDHKGRKLVPKFKGSSEKKWVYNGNTNPNDLR